MNMKGFNPKTLTCGAASEKNARPAKKIRNTEWKAILLITRKSQCQQVWTDKVHDFYIKASKLKLLIKKTTYDFQHAADSYYLLSK